MRNLNLLNGYRQTGPEIVKTYGSTGDHGNGFFVVPSPLDKARMVVIASNGFGWDHVSVSRKNRCPNWPEMDHIRQLFFDDDEVVLQFHMPAKLNISNHPYCLHMWREQGTTVSLPPPILVGIKEAGDLRKTERAA